MAFVRVDKVEEGLYQDIEVLVESITDLEEMKQFKVTSDMSIQERRQKGELFLADIAGSVNGYGRIT